MDMFPIVSARRHSDKAAGTREIIAKTESGLRVTHNFCSICTKGELYAKLHHSRYGKHCCADELARFFIDWYKCCIDSVLHFFTKTDWRFADPFCGNICWAHCSSPRCESTGNSSGVEDGGKNTNGIILEKC